MTTSRFRIGLVNSSLPNDGIFSAFNRKKLPDRWEAIFDEFRILLIKTKSILELILILKTVISSNGNNIIQNKVCYVIFFYEKIVVFKI